MSIKDFEIDFVKNILKIGEVTEENIEEQLPREVYDFLKTNENFKTIVDRCIYRKRTRARPFDSMIITKFMTEDFDVHKKFEEILSNISGHLLLYIDFHFLILVKSESGERVFKFQHGSKSSAFNETYKIVAEKDVDDLLKELNKKTFSDFLNESFINHRDIFEYHGSGFTPYMLLSLVFTIQKLL